MHNSKLVYLLKTFDKKELNELDKFIRSPYCNTNQTFLSFWEYLQAAAPDFLSKKLAAKIAFAYLFPTATKFEERKLRNLKTRFLQLVEQFLVFEALKKDTFTTKKKLKEAYYARDMYSRFEVIGKEMKNDLQKKTIKTDKDFYKLLQLNHDFYFNQRSDKQLKAPPHLEQCSKNLDNYYWLTKLKYACEWYSRKNRHNETIPTESSTFKLPKTFLNTGSPLFILYKNILSILQLPTGKSKGILLFENTIKLFRHHLPNIPPDDQLILLTHLLNYGIAGTRVQNQPFLNNLFDLYDLGIRQKILFWKEELQIVVIINVVHIGCKLEKFGWAQTMLAENKQYIATKHKERFVSFAMATIQFYQKEFKETIFNLENLKFDDFGIEVARRSLQLRSGFECFLQDKTYTDFVKNKARNFKLFLQRKNRISKNKATAYLNLIEAILQAIVILDKETVDKEVLKQLIHSITEKEAVMEKEWLLSLLSKQ